MMNGISGCQMLVDKLPLFSQGEFILLLKIINYENKSVGSQ